MTKTLKILSIAFIAAYLVSPVASATQPSKKHVTFYDYLTSKDFSCSLNKRVIKPGSVSQDYETTGTKSACLITYRCNPEPGIEAKSFTANNFCLASDDGVCEEAMDCARRDLKKGEKKYFATKVVAVSTTNNSSKNKHNDVCWETNGIKDRRGIIQLVKDDSVVEEACVTAYVCKSRPEPSGLACAPKREKSEVVCPQLDDCINGDISIPGYSEEDLRKVALESPDKARTLRSELAKPASVIGSTPPGNAVSATSFQPRTANIVGSRTSGSNPPASTPPATGHTGAGRGMK